MRTFDEIKYIIVDAKNSSEALAELNSTSKVAIWNEWANNIAYAHYVLEQSFDQHKMEVLGYLTQLKPHTARWYRNKALAFQYGFDLVTDQDYFDNTGFTDEQIETSKIIKYSAVTEAEIESRLIVKIATEIGTELQPISESEKEAFTAYMKEIRDAGVRITVINYLPDILQLTMQIYSDPLVIDSNGNSILTGKRPVEDAIKEYMKELPFDGELVLAHLIDKLQKVEGVRIPHLLSAASKWIDANINDYGAFQPINVKKIPISGYFKVEDFLNISYVV
jgi:hypothetical protein